MCKYMMRILTWICACMLFFIHLCTCVLVNVCTCTCMHACMHVYIYIYIYIYIYTHIYIYIYTHILKCKGIHGQLEKEIMLQLNHPFIARWYAMPRHVPTHTSYIRVYIGDMCFACVCVYLYASGSRLDCLHLLSTSVPCHVYALLSSMPERCHLHILTNIYISGAVSLRNVSFVCTRHDIWCRAARWLRINAHLASWYLSVRINSSNSSHTRTITHAHTQRRNVPRFYQAVSHRRTWCWRWSFLAHSAPANQGEATRKKLTLRLLVYLCDWKDFTNRLQ